MNDRNRLSATSPWEINYPVQVFYEPGPLLKPEYLRHVRGHGLLLKLLRKFRFTYRPSLVQRLLRVNERVVETPFVISNIADEDERVLDIGCCESVLPVELAHLGHKVWAVDQRNYPLVHPNLTFLQADVCSTGLPSGFFDAAISLSTIEHIGIGFYGDPEHESGDVKAIKELWRVLKPGGKLVLTAPYGVACDGWQRVYDSKRLAVLLSGFTVRKIRYFKKNEDSESWIEVKEPEVSTADSSEVTEGLVLLVATKDPAPGAQAEA